MNIFNEAWYLSNNPDVAAAVERGEITAQAHFELHGKYENRSPSPLFDPELYLDANPDVAAVVAAGLITAFEHFVGHGAEEGRDASLFFDAQVYLAANPDVAAAIEAGMFASAYEHFVLHGQHEPRNTSQFFDLKGYLDANPDVAAAVRAGGFSAFDHFMGNGFQEGRSLGNGISLLQFANDPRAQSAIENGDVEAVMQRVAEVAPFLPTYVPPTGYTIPANQPLPTDFVPVEGQELVIPDGVNAPDDLPPGFEQPQEPQEPQEPSRPTDRTPPTVSIEVADTNLDEGGSTQLTVTFSEAVRGFDISDIEVEGGTVSELTGSGNTYGVTFLPSDSITSARVSIGAGAYTDVAGNPGAGAALSFISGSSEADEIEGTAAADLIFGHSGDDAIFGDASDHGAGEFNLLTGGDGSDRFLANAGVGYVEEGADGPIFEISTNGFSLVQDFEADSDQLDMGIDVTNIFRDNLDGTDILDIHDVFARFQGLNADVDANGEVAVLEITSGAMEGTYVMAIQVPSPDGPWGVSVIGLADTGHSLQLPDFYQSPFVD